MTINNLTSVSYNEKYLRKIVKIIFLSENKKEKDLSVALVGQKRMRVLNKKYREKNQSTDILAFPKSKSCPERFKLKSVQKIQETEEIAICPQEVKKNAKKYNLTFEKELTRVLIHGLLHLLGYNHEKSELEAKKMRKKEEYYLDKVQSMKCEI